MLCLAAALAGGGGEVVYARRPSVSIRSSRDPFDSEVVGRVRYGERLEVLEREGRWLRVRTRGVEGFVHAANVSEEAPKDLDERGLVRLGAGDVSGGAAARPFGEVARAYGRGHPQADMAAVEAMEKVFRDAKARAEALDAFQRAGRLGDYAYGGGR
jgi:hypothetical protein